VYLTLTLKKQDVVNEKKIEREVRFPVSAEIGLSHWAWSVPDLAC